MRRLGRVGIILLILGVLLWWQLGYWSPDKERQFLAGCRQQISGNMSPEAARRFCPCILEAIEDEYPLFLNFARLSNGAKRDAILNRTSMCMQDLLDNPPEIDTTRVDTAL